MFPPPFLKDIISGDSGTTIKTWQEIKHEEIRTD